MDLIEKWLDTGRNKACDAAEDGVYKNCARELLRAARSIQEEDTKARKKKLKNSVDALSDLL